MKTLNFEKHFYHSITEDVFTAMNNDLFGYKRFDYRGYHERSGIADEGKTENRFVLYKGGMIQAVRKKLTAFVFEKNHILLKSNKNKADYLVRTTKATKSNKSA